MNEIKKVFPEDVILIPEVKTLYKSENGKYYLNEEAARQKLATHFKCNCGNGVREQFRIYCDSCEPPKQQAPFKEWDKETPVYCKRNDQYFFNLDQLTDYLVDNEIEPEDLVLFICEPNHLHTLDSETWIDVLPEDGDLPEEVLNKLYELNEAIIKYGKNISWEPGKYRTEYKK